MKIVLEIIKEVPNNPTANEIIREGKDDEKATNN